MSQLVLKHPDLKHEDLKFNTVEVHAGEPRDMYGALIPPIYQTSTFYFDSTDDAVKACDDYAESFAYSRITNPSVDYLEQKLAALEHGKGAVAYASGMGAVSGAIFALLKSGDHAIFTKAKYSGTEDVTSDWLPRFGIAHDTFDAADLSQLEGLIKPNTKLIYVESPANPTMVLVDIAAVVEIAHKHGIKVFIDNTFATPYNTTPLDLGVDAVIHSLTKYIGGHGDLLGGAVISNDEQFLRECRLGTLMHFGSVMAPFTAFLVCRGLKTLGVRMKQYNESALKIAKWLEANPKIETVRYPFLESNPQYAIAKKQMKGGGGMISFDVAGGLEAGKKFINSLKLCTLAVSLGDKGSVDSPQTIEFYFNFIGKFEAPATEQGPTPEEILLMEKRQKIREKRHEAYLRRKSTGWQATYYWKNKRARKEKMDAAKEAIRAEDQAKGIYYHPKQRKEQKDEEELIAMDA